MFDVIHAVNLSLAVLLVRVYYCRSSVAMLQLAILQQPTLDVTELTTGVTGECSVAWLASGATAGALRDISNRRSVAQSSF